jgi:hypothetical protein
MRFLIAFALPVVTSQPALAQAAAPSAQAVAAAAAMVEAISPAAAEKAALDQQLANIRRGALIFQLIANNQQVQAAVQNNRAGVEAMLARAGAIQADALAPIFSQQQAAVRQASVQAYAQQFTIAELNAISAFYRSAAGQKLRTTQPQIAQTVGRQVQQQFAQALQNANQSVAPRVRTEVNSLFPNLISDGTAAPATPAPAAAPPRR